MTFTYLLASLVWVMGENVIERGTLISTMLEFGNKKQILELRGFSSLFEWTQEQHCSEKEAQVEAMQHVTEL